MRPYTSIFIVHNNVRRLTSLAIICLLGACLQVQAQQPAGTYNVKTDGTAVGNGINDDTAEIQSALTAAKAQGKDVYFPAGTYLISGQIDVPNATSVFGDKSGISLIKSNTPATPFGEPDNDGTTIGNLSIEDMFFLNVSVYFTGYQKHNIAVKRCVMASDKVHTTSWDLCRLGRGDDDLIEDCIFIAGHDTGNWPGLNVIFKAIGNYRNNRMIIRRNIIGLDMGNLTWLDTEWEGYAHWTNVESRLQQFRSNQNLPRRMGEMSGGIRLNDCDSTVVDKNIFNFDPIATDVPQTTGYLDVDHIIYATQATNLEITRNWMRGQPPNANGGLKHRDTEGPGVIAANYLDDTPIILYTYDNDLTHDFENQLIYRNHLRITDFTSIVTSYRFGIWFWSTDLDDVGFDGENIDVASNVFDVDPQSRETDVPIDITNGHTGPSDWRVYTSNTYLDSGNIIPVTGNGAGPYALTAGSPSSSTWDLAKYDAMAVPFLNIPVFGTDPSGNIAPVFTTDPVVAANATQDSAYSSSIADNASDANGDSLTFSVISGPSWLNVATNGMLSGTPTSTNIGLNSWIVEVTDGTDTDTATLEIIVNYIGGITASFTNNTPVAISSSGTPTITSDINVAGVSGSILDVNVGFDISHTYDADLVITLIAPDSTEVLLVNKRGGSADNFSDTALDDSASTAISSGSAPFSGTYRPEQVLSSLNGKAPNGTWTLKIQDTFDQDGGSLNSWSLTLETDAPPANNPPVFDSDPVVEAHATKGAAYNGSIADDASDADGDTMSFTQASGPGWLTLSTNGVLSGTPVSADVGLNSWSIWVSDGMDSNSTTLEITVDSDGDWDDDDIPDAWELLYYGHETNAVASWDDDADGYDARSEYIAGFDPTNGLSYPVVTGFEMLNGGSNYVISWEAPTPDRAYDILWADSLTGGYSNAISDLLYPQNSYTGTVNQVSPYGFYRIDYKLQGAP